MTRPRGSLVQRWLVAGGLLFGCSSTHDGDAARSGAGVVADPSDAGDRQPATADSSRRRALLDAGDRDAIERDASERDASVRDVSLRDASERDASERDAGERDASAQPGVPADGGARDADAACTIAAQCDSSLVEVGHGLDAVDQSWGTAALAPNRWLLGTVTIPAGDALKVFELRAVLAGVPTPADGRAIRMALWTDASGAHGRQPGSLVAHTSIAAAGNGLNSLPITSTLKPQLTPGAKYWIGINTSRLGTTLARRQGSGDEVTLDAFAGDVPVDTLQSFPDVAPSYATSDYALSVLAKRAL